MRAVPADSGRRPGLSGAPGSTDRLEFTVNATVGSVPAQSWYTWGRDRRWSSALEVYGRGLSTLISKTIGTSGSGHRSRRTPLLRTASARSASGARDPSGTTTGFRTQPTALRSTHWHDCGLWLTRSTTNLSVAFKPRNFVEWHEQKEKGLGGSQRGILNGVHPRLGHHAALQGFRAAEHHAPAFRQMRPAAFGPGPWGLPTWSSPQRYADHSQRVVPLIMTVTDSVDRLLNTEAGWENWPESLTGADFPAAWYEEMVPWRYWTSDHGRLWSFGQVFRSVSGSDSFWPGGRGPKLGPWTTRSRRTESEWQGHPNQVRTGVGSPCLRMFRRSAEERGWHRGRWGAQVGLVAVVVRLSSSRA